MFTVKVKDEVFWDYMIRNNLSMREFADKLAVSHSYLSQLLAHDRTPSPRMRRKMLAALSPLTFDDLFIVARGQEDVKPAPAKS